jgi:hypothetical protein
MSIHHLPERRSPQQIGRDFEALWADRHGLRAQPGSGNLPAYPLDVGGAGILASLKHTIHRSFSVTAEMIHEMAAAARGPRSRGTQMPVLVVKVDGVDEPVWVMLESDALSLARGEAGVEVKAPTLAQRRAAAEPVIGGDDDAA